MSKVIPFFLVLFLLLVFGSQAKAQLQVQGYPVVFSQVNQQLMAICPAATAAFSLAEVSVTNRTNLGIWRNNQTYIALGSVRIRNEKSKDYHGIGVNLYFDKEGNYLRRYRGYLQYAYHITLTQKWMLSAGTSLGIMTYQGGTHDTEVNGMSSSIDGSFGAMLHKADFFAGASVAQAFRGQVQPLQEITILPTYYQLLMGKSFQLSQNLLFKNTLLTRILPKRASLDLLLSTGAIWKEVIGLYTSYMFRTRNSPDRISIMAGLEKFHIDDHHFRAYISYDRPLKGDHRYQAFEITLQYLFTGKKNEEQTEEDDEEVTF